MLHDHHQVQGLWQSKEYEQCCFFAADAKRFLTEGPFVSGWFELWDIYDKYSTLHASAAGKKSAELGLGIHAPGMASKGGTKSAELGLGIHAPGMQSKGGKTQPRETKVKSGKKAAELGLGAHAPGMASKGGTKSAELGLGVHGRSAEQMAEDGSKGGKEGSKTTNSQEWICLVTGHISNSGGLSRWQNARGIDTSKRVKLAG